VLCGLPLTELRSGAIIGENERLTPYEAIKGLPIGVLINILKKAGL
jgi:phosphohistidine swiveling domain-containing protein